MTDETETPTTETSGAGSDTPPDRLSIDPASEYFDYDVLQRGIGIRFNGQERTTVDEYCVSEGWIKIAAPKSRDRHGKAMMLMLKGKVDAYFKDVE